MKVFFLTCFLSISVCIVSDCQADSFKTNPPNDGAVLAKEAQKSTIGKNEKERLSELTKLAKSSVGWNTSSVGPIHSVNMDKLKSNFAAISLMDTPLLFKLLENPDIKGNTREAIKYLLSMQGMAIIQDLERNEAENPWLSVDYFHIRQNMISRPWIKNAR